MIRANAWKKLVSGILTVMLLSGSLPDMGAYAAEMTGGETTAETAAEAGEEIFAQRDGDETEISSGDGGDGQEDPDAPKKIAGLKLNKLASSAQGYKEIVLNFTAVKNGTESTDTEAVYYEVKVSAAAAEADGLPAGSSVEPRYFYIPKAAGSNTQSKSIQVNDGDLSGSTACDYVFTVRMVSVSRQTEVPDEDTAVWEPVDTVFAGNSITKTFATKELYYEDKLGFKKKKTTVCSGQQDVFAGTVKYSKNASVLHDLMAVAYGADGQICPYISCSFRNDDDELYISTGKYTTPGKYKVVIYAGIGEELDPSSPQSGTMYQANTSFTLTVQAGIGVIDTDMIADQVAVYNKNITFSAVPTGYHGNGSKAKIQKFTYTIRSAVRDSRGGLTVTEPVEKVRSNVSVNKNGKVTIKKGFYVDDDPDKNWIAIVIGAADYEGNETRAVKYVNVISTVSVPTKIVLRIDRDGKNLGTKLTADKAHEAYVVVLDQNGKDMTSQVRLTPSYKTDSSPAISVRQAVNSGEARLNVNRPGTVTIKAAATNGSGKSKSVKITVTEPVFSKTYYSISSITCDGFPASEIDTNNGYVKYSAPRGAVIKLRIGPKINDKPYLKLKWVDWEFDVSGGKLKVDGEYLLLTPAAKKTTLNYTNGSDWWHVDFINDNWNTRYDAAQKVKLVEGALYTNAYNNKNSLIDGSELPDQLLTWQYEYGSYDEIRIAKISKNAPQTQVTDFDPEHKTFALAFPPNGLKAGSYKYKVAFYKDNALMGKPSTITVKVKKASQVKVTSSYTLNTARQDFIELKYSPKQFLPDFEAGLLNANVKGRANDFNKYFELAYVWDSDAGQEKVQIRFKRDVTEEEKEALAGKSMTGYVKYSYHMGYSYIKNATAKITIKIK